MLAGGSFVHQVLDSMWNAPVTLLWPLLGWQFEKGAEYGSFWQYLLVIYRNLGNINSLDGLSMLMTEILGIVLIVIFGLGYLRQKIIEHSSTN
jgi:hypothetical protein